MPLVATLPRHIAVIMDGNGRWAKQRKLPRAAGHKAGVDTCRRIVKACLERGVEALSVFAFSRENWRRPVSEVDYLMGLFLLALNRDIKELHHNNVRLRFIGDIAQLDPKLQQKIKKAEELTQHNTKLTLVIATNYGGQWDILQASRQLAKKVADGDILADDITMELFDEHLVTAGLPPIDLFIRTSGVTRISNFFLWQLSYTELHFTDVFWPDFTKEHFDQAIEDFQARQRRFGCTPEQMGEMSA